MRERERQKEGGDVHTCIHMGEDSIQGYYSNMNIIHYYSVHVRACGVPVYIHIVRPHWLNGELGSLVLNTLVTCMSGYG